MSQRAKQTTAAAETAATTTAAADKRKGKKNETAAKGAAGGKGKKPGKVTGKTPKTARDAVTQPTAKLKGARGKKSKAKDTAENTAEAVTKSKPSKGAAALRNQLARARAAAQRVQGTRLAIIEARRRVAQQFRKENEEERREHMASGRHGWGPADPRNYLYRGGYRTLKHTTIGDLTRAAGIVSTRDVTDANTDAVFAQMLELAIERANRQMHAMPQVGAKDRILINAECVRRAFPEFVMVGPLAPKREKREKR